MDVLKAMSQGTYVLQPGNLAGLNRIMNLKSGILWVLACACIAFLMPNVDDLLVRGKHLGIERRLQTSVGATWFGFASVIVLLLLAITETRGVSEFLYFNF